MTPNSEPKPETPDGAATSGAGSRDTVLKDPTELRLRVLIVDDEPLAIERTLHLLAEIPNVEVVGSAKEGDEAIDCIRALRPDLVLLDIQMPGRSGIAVAEALAGEAAPDIVFVSAFDHYAARAFEVDATDYLLKPVSSERLSRALQRARRRRAGLQAQPAPATRNSETASDHFWVPTKHGALRVPLSEVNWVEAAGDYVLIHTPVRTHLLRATMLEMTEKLAPSGVVRAHRSALVRPEAVSQVTRSARGGLNLVIRDGSTVAVGPSYQRAVLEILGVR